MRIIQIYTAPGKVPPAAKKTAENRHYFFIPSPLKIKCKFAAKLHVQKCQYLRNCKYC